MKLASKHNRGFTLIELLVVVVIIGILATIVVGVLSSAKTDSKDVSIKSEMVSLRTQSEIIYTNNNLSYDAICGTNGEIQDDFISKIINKINSTNGSGDVNCAGDNDVWSFAVELPGGGVLCVDKTAGVRENNSNGDSYDSIIGGTTPAIDNINDTSCN